MGSPIEINDTLKISKERGFPKDLHLDSHIVDPETSRRLLGKEFTFWNNDERLYARPPTRAWLVEETSDGKWLYWGHVFITEQTISHGKTSGKYRIIKIYKPDYQHIITIEESPPGKSYFSDKPTSLI